MTCETTQNWFMLTAEAASAEIAEHIRSCARCEKLLAEVQHLDQLWRDRPLPGRAGITKAAFMERLNNQSAPVLQNSSGYDATRLAKSKPSRLAGARYFAAAAMLFVVVGAAFLLFGPGQQAAAQADVIDQLIDWNLDLSEAESPLDRQRIFADRHEKLKKILQSAKLEQADRVLAENLVANAAWLAQNEDLGEELQRFNLMADQLLERVKAASTTDRVHSDRYAKQFRKVNERGIDPSLDRLTALRNADPERRKLINRILKHDKKRAEQINEILEKSPDITKKELRQALDAAHKRDPH